MSFLLKFESTLHLSSNQAWLNLVHSDDLGWYITFNQQGQMLVQNLSRIVSRPNLTKQGQILYCTTNLRITENLWKIINNHVNCQIKNIVQTKKEAAENIAVFDFIWIVFNISDYIVYIVYWRKQFSSTILIYALNGRIGRVLTGY